MAVIGEPPPKEKARKIGKERLDARLVALGLFPSRERARAAIMAGTVFVNQQKIEKAGALVSLDAAIETRGNALPFVSRGGLKLAKALRVFPLDLNGAVMADIGASTGGFTDCALRNGAAKVYAIDVGYGQLAWNLRTDERVINLERTNIRYVGREIIGEPLDFVSIDVSFISLAKVLPAAYDLLKVGGKAVALIKPQFEAGKGRVGKNGVVKDFAVHREVIGAVFSAAAALGFSCGGLDFSPIKGPEGNIEYLALLEKSEGGAISGENDCAAEIGRVVAAAQDALEKLTPAESERNFLEGLQK